MRGVFDFTTQVHQNSKMKLTICHSFDLKNKFYKKYFRNYFSDFQ
jgi:hypothetical protein